MAKRRSRDRFLPRRAPTMWEEILCHNDIKSNGKAKPAFFPKTLYKARARIEQAVGKLKRFKRIALRCEKTARNFLSFIHLSAAFTLIKSVHTA